MRPLVPVIPNTSAVREPTEPCAAQHWRNAGSERRHVVQASLRRVQSAAQQPGDVRAEGAAAPLRHVLHAGIGSRLFELARMGNPTILAMHGRMLPECRVPRRCTALRKTCRNAGAFSATLYSPRGTIRVASSRVESKSVLCRLPRSSRTAGSHMLSDRQRSPANVYHERRTCFCGSSCSRVISPSRVNSRCSRGRPRILRRDLSRLRRPPNHLGDTHLGSVRVDRQQRFDRIRRYPPRLRAVAAALRQLPLEAPLPVEPEPAIGGPFRKLDAATVGNLPPSHPAPESLLRRDRRLFGTGADTSHRNSATACQFSTMPSCIPQSPPYRSRRRLELPAGSSSRRPGAAGRAISRWRVGLRSDAATPQVESDRIGNLRKTPRAPAAEFSQGH